MKSDAQLEVGNLRFPEMKPRARITAKNVQPTDFFWSDNNVHLMLAEVFLCLFPGKKSSIISRKNWNNVKSEIF